MKPYRLGLLVLTLTAAAPALAQEKPRFCPTRPDLDAGPCTTEPGHIVFEMSALDWQRDDDATAREDTVISGDALVRFGLGPSTEMQVGWTAFGHVRTRDKLMGAIVNRSGTGDVTVAIRQNLRHPDGKGFAYAVQPFVTLPTGGRAIGAGDWGAGVLLPVNYDLNDKLAIEFTGELDAAVDQDGDGRHDAYSGIVGLSYDVSDQVTMVGEFMAERDDDPQSPETHALVAGSVAWQPRDRLQFDLLATAGLNHDTPDFRLVTGGAVLF